MTGTDPYDAGYSDASQGIACNNPHKLWSTAWHAWHRGYSDYMAGALCGRNRDQ